MTQTAPYSLAPLPYAVEALEPHIDAQTMTIHHGKHHQAYVTNLNNALANAGPAKDVALQSAVGHAFGMERRPGDRALAAMAESWAPHRATAARLLWAYYAHMRGRDGAPPVELREKG